MQPQADLQMALLGSIQVADRNQDNEIGSSAAEERTAGTVEADKMVHYYHNMYFAWHYQEIHNSDCVRVERISDCHSECH